MGCCYGRPCCDGCFGPGPCCGGCCGPCCGPRHGYGPGFYGPHGPMMGPPRYGGYGGYGGYGRY